MRFNILGTLEATKDDTRILLGGVNQRAILGFLLLHVNEVTPTGDLVKALWGDEPPPTARKMVQNGVAGLRRAFSGEYSVSLDTMQPGYLLRANPRETDLWHFRKLVKQGRSAFRAGEWDSTSRLLREALALWRGPALADLTDAVGRWPELTRLYEERLAALEVCLEAELALGLHRELIGEMASLVEERPTSERLCRLFMLALYRCGRQSEALAAYRRTRSRLADEFGLDPGPELQVLERQILNQHPALASPAAGALPGAGEAFARTDGIPGAADGLHAAAVTAAVTAHGARIPAGPAGNPAGKGAAPSDTGPDGPATGAPSAPVPWDAGITGAAERKYASIVLIQTCVNGATDDPESVEEATADVNRVVRDVAARFGGLLRAPLGTVRPMVFGFPRAYENDPERAVRAALTIRDRLPPASGRATVRLAVATGEVLATYRTAGDAAPAGLTGGVLDTCIGLLSRTRPGGVRACEVTLRAAGTLFHRAGGGPDQGWEITAARPRAAAPPPATRMVGRERELESLLKLLDEVRRRRRPHLVTLFGEPGLGKSRLVAEFRRAVRDLADPGPRLSWYAKSFGADGLDTSATGARAGLGTDTVFAALQEAPDAPAGASGPASLSGPAGPSSPVGPSGPAGSVCLFGAGGPYGPGGPGGPDVEIGSPGRDGRRGQGGQERRRSPASAAFTAWQHHLEEAAAEGPVVVFLEDLHRADADLLDHLEDLTERLARVPLLLVATARPELRQHRPGWGRDRPGATAITLDPLSDDAAEELLNSLLNGPSRHEDPTGPAAQPGQTGPAEPDGCPKAPAVRESGARELVPLVGGNPLFAREYAAAPPARPTGGPPPPPPLVRGVITARLDTLPPAEKAVLREVTVLGEQLSAGGVAALTGLDPARTAEVLLSLEEKGFLHRVWHDARPEETGYGFRQALVRDLAYAQLPRKTRVVLHRRAAAWIAGLPPHRGDLLVHHYRWLVALTTSTSTGRPDAAMVTEAYETLTAAGDRAAAAGAYRTATRCHRSAHELRLCAASRRRFLLPPQSPAPAAPAETASTGPCPAREDVTTSPGG
ncbi:BTAD domain-containing putative transcriptional regulator [Streptomyces sp. NPDC055025]